MSVAQFSIQIALLVGVLVFALGTASGQARDTDVRLTTCHVTGFEPLATCGTIEVPADWDRPDSGTVSLSFVVLPPSGGGSGAPVFFVTGGPGLAASDDIPNAARVLDVTRRKHPLVFVDWRGTGNTAPLQCDLKRYWKLARLDPVAACLAEFPGDPEQYGTLSFVRDLDAVRAGLGVEQINLLGRSIGSRAVLFYMKTFPERVRAVVLDGVLPPARNHLKTEPVAFAIAFERILTACRQQPDCNDAFPNLQSDLATLMRRLKRSPKAVTLGDPVAKVVVDAQTFMYGLRGALLRHDLVPLIPFAIDAFNSGDAGPWRVLAQSLDWEARLDLSVGVHLTVLCSEDYARLDEAEKTARVADGIFPGDRSHLLAKACKSWPDVPLPKDFAGPVTSDAPVLMLSGAHDPLLSPTFAEEAALTLSNARHLVAPTAGHGVYSLACFPDLIAEFFDTTDPEAFDPACLDKLAPLPFVVSAAGPRP